MSTLTHAEAPEAEVTTLTVDADALCQALDDVLLCAPGVEDPDLPMLDGVHLATTEHEGQQVLVLTASDRFLLGVAHLPAKGSLPPIVLPQRAARALAELVRRRVDGDVPLRTEQVILDVTSDGSQLLVTSPYADEPGRATSSATVLATRTSVTFPQVAGLLTAPVEPSADPVTVNPQLLYPLLTIATRRPGGHMSITTSRADRAVRVRIGERFHALLMPVRPHEQLPSAFTPPTPQT